MQATKRSIRYSASSQRRLESQPTVTRHCIGLRSGSRHLAIFYWVSSLSFALLGVVVLRATIDASGNLDRATRFQCPAIFDNFGIVNLFQEDIVRHNANRNFVSIIYAELLIQRTEV